MISKKELSRTLAFRSEIDSQRDDGGVVRRSSDRITGSSVSRIKKSRTQNNSHSVMIDKVYF
ncbi:MAG: hypothetical protein ACI8W0_001532 [Flavobacterium sp.]|jgi:hypothetical protein